MNPNLLMIVWGLLTLADHFTTNIALKHGLVEENTFLAKIIQLWGTLGLFGAKLILFGVGVYLYNRFGIDQRVLAGICGAYGIVVAHNIYLILKVEKKV